MDQNPFEVLAIITVSILIALPICYLIQPEDVGIGLVMLFMFGIPTLMCGLAKLYERRKQSG
jgi:hypothetical protein